MYNRVFYIPLQRHWNVCVCVCTYLFIYLSINKSFSRSEDDRAIDEDRRDTSSEPGGLASYAQKRRTKHGDSTVKDEAYWERRRKNNEAAKRSRDARRAKEEEIAIRGAFLEQENMKLRAELSTLKSETAKLRCLLYNS